MADTENALSREDLMKNAFAMDDLLGKLTDADKDDVLQAWRDLPNQKSYRVAMQAKAQAVLGGFGKR